MQFIFQHQPEKSEKQRGFFETLQNAVSGTSPKSEKQGESLIKHSLFNLDKASEMIEQHETVYEKTLKLIQKSGLNEGQAQEILDDSTNPYAADTLDFVESMDKDGIKFIGISKTGNLVFAEKGKDNYSYESANRALKWKNLIYPNVLEVSKGFKYGIVEKAINDKTPEMEKFIASLVNYGMPEFGQDEAVRRELRRLSSGEKIASDKQNKIQKYEEIIRTEEDTKQKTEIQSAETYEEIKDDGLAVMDSIAEEYPELQGFNTNFKEFFINMDSAIKEAMNLGIKPVNILKEIFTNRPDLQAQADELETMAARLLSKEVSKESDEYRAKQEFLDLAGNLFRGSLENYNIPTTI